MTEAEEEKSEESVERIWRRVRFALMMKRLNGFRPCQRLRACDAHDILSHLFLFVCVCELREVSSVGPHGSNIQKGWP